MRGDDPGLGVPSGGAGDWAGGIRQGMSEGPSREAATNNAGPRSILALEAELETGTEGQGLS